MVFHAFILACAANLSTCTLMTTPDGPYAEKTVCEQRLNDGVMQAVGVPQFDDFMAEGNTFVAECVSYPDGYDINAHQTAIMRRILRIPHPESKEAEG